MRKKEPVEFHEYNSEWPNKFEREKALILDLIGDVVLDIQHVGSTAVPNLAAKPVIDIMIAVENLQQIKDSVPKLEALDYEYCGEAGIPGRIFFRKHVDGKRAFHIHSVQPDSEVWHEFVPFRDYLRAHPEVMREYELLKRELAAKYKHDRVQYTEGKAEFIQKILRRVKRGK